MRLVSVGIGGGLFDEANLAVARAQKSNNSLYVKCF